MHTVSETFDRASRSALPFVPAPMLSIIFNNEACWVSRGRAKSKNDHQEEINGLIRNFAEFLGLKIFT